MKRFWDKVNKNGPLPAHAPELGQCWLWVAGLTSDGYGAFWLEGRTIPAHNVSLKLAGIEIPENMQPDHLCRVRPCVRPSHIRPLTLRENILAGVGPSARNAQKTHCKNGHALAGSNLIIQKRGIYDKRICRACRIAFKREWRRTHPEAVKRENAQALARYYAKN